MIRTRLLALPALAVLATTMLVGCGDTKSPASTTPSATEDAMMSEDAMATEDAMMESEG